LDLQIQNPKSKIQNPSMLFRQANKTDSDEGLLKLPARQPRIHSVAALARGPRFDGSFSIGDANYDLSYAPSRVSVVGWKLQLLGRLTVKDSRGQTHSRDQVKAKLVATQGGIGSAPTRPGNPASGAPAASDLPQVESTGTTSFTGVMYLHFEPLVGSALGVHADMSRVQLNARFAPLDDAERELHAVYSSVINALDEKQANAATPGVNELNSILARK
jgi:hypothetical protein